MKLFFLVGSVLLITGCQDISKSAQNVDSVEKTEVVQEIVPTDDADQYRVEGLTRFDNQQDEGQLETVVEEITPIPAKAPIRIDLKLNPAWAEYGLGMIDVQSTTDQVIIEKVILNRGQCSAIDNSIPMPVTLGFVVLIEVILIIVV